MRSPPLSGSWKSPPTPARCKRSWPFGIGSTPRSGWRSASSMAEHSGSTTVTCSSVTWCATRAARRAAPPPTHLQARKLGELLTLADLPRGRLRRPGRRRCCRRPLRHVALFREHGELSVPAGVDRRAARDGCRTRPTPSPSTTGPKPNTRTRCTSPPPSTGAASCRRRSPATSRRWSTPALQRLAAPQDFDPQRRPSGRARALETVFHATSSTTNASRGGRCRSHVDVTITAGELARGSVVATSTPAASPPSRAQRPALRQRHPPAPGRGPLHHPRLRPSTTARALRPVPGPPTRDHGCRFPACNRPRRGPTPTT